MRGSQRTRLTPIIFLTANEQSEAAVLKGYASGVDYMFKPFDPKVLKPKVQALLDQQRNRRMLQRLTRELEAARAFNGSILENAAEGILVVDAQGVISFANPAISRLLAAPCTFRVPNCSTWCSFPLPAHGLNRSSTALTWGKKSTACTTRNCAPWPASLFRWHCRARRCQPTSRPWW